MNNHIIFMEAYKIMVLGLGHQSQEEELKIKIGHLLMVVMDFIPFDIQRIKISFTQNLKEVIS